MEWKLLIIAFGSHLVIATGGFVLIPKEPPLFGMGMIPGPLALLSAIGFPVIASVGISVAVYRKSKIRKGINSTFFFVGSMIVWVLTFFLFH